MLAILYGVNEIIKLTTINFPASVTCMLLLYAFLAILAKIFGEKKISPIIKIIEIPSGFSLRWINIFFTPAFVTLPLSSWISAKEALTIAAVFVFGYIIATAIIAYFTIFLQFILKKGRKSNIERAEELNLNEETNPDALSTAINSHNESSDESIYSIQDLDLERIKSLNEVPQNIVIDLPKGDINPTEENFIKRINTRIDEENELNITMNHPNLLSPSSSIHLDYHHLEKPSPIASPIRPLNPGVDVKFTKNKLFCKRAIIEQLQIDRNDLSIRIGHFIKDNFDYFVFFILFIVGLPVYFVLDYDMPLQLSIAIFMFLFVLRAPPQRYKRFFHPVLCSVILSWFWFYIFGLMKHETLFDWLDQYKTGITYLKVFYNIGKPGAGDIFSTLLDVSIVSLSIPMYTYRSDLRRHLIEIILPILVMSAGCFFIYPPLCYHIGISPERSLGFAGRSITLALGTPFVNSLDGSIPLMAVTTVISGIIGALTCQPFFKFLRIRDDDYVTRGITLGLNCGAIATAHLLTIDPRAAAMSSLSFVLFGTVMVVMAAINPLAHLIQSWAGLI